MAYQDQIGNSQSSGRNSKNKVTAGLIIFVLGVVAGVVGLCAAAKIIFYIGLAVAILAAIALVWGLLTVKNKVTDTIDDDELRRME